MTTRAEATSIVRSDDELAAHAEQLRRSGMQVRVVLAGTDKASTLMHFARVLDFPDWFGPSYDALFDCLLNVTPRPVPQGMALIWQGTAGLRRQHPEVFDTVLLVLGDAAEERGDLWIAFADDEREPSGIAASAMTLNTELSPS